MDKVVYSSNNRFKYAALREMKVHIKHGELRVDPEVEEEDLEKIEKHMNYKSFWDLSKHSLRSEQTQTTIKRDDDAYGKEWSLLHVLVSMFASFFPVFWNIYEFHFFVVQF